jgi:long-chain acyl-CoA synthetase
MYPLRVMKFETLVELMEKAGQEHAANEALGTRKGPGRWEWIHYRDLKKMVDEARGGLAALGVKKGDRIAIISNNRVEWVVTAFAAYGLGGVLVPMYEAQAPEEWKFILNDAGASRPSAASAVKSPPSRAWSV